MVTDQLSVYLAKVLLGDANPANLAKVGIDVNGGKWSSVSKVRVNGVSVRLSKMVQDVIGNRSKAYIVSQNSGFSKGSNVSMYAKLRQGSLTAMNNGFNIKDETSGVTTLKGAMAVMDIAETAIANLDQIRAEKRMW